MLLACACWVPGTLASPVMSRQRTSRLCDELWSLLHWTGQVDGLAASWGCGGQAVPCLCGSLGISVLSDKGFLFISSVCS